MMYDEQLINSIQQIKQRIHPPLHLCCRCNMRVVAQSVLYLPLTISLSRKWGAPLSSKSLVFFFLFSVSCVILAFSFCHSESPRRKIPHQYWMERHVERVDNPKACSTAHMMWPSAHPPTPPVSSHRQASWHTGSVLRSTQLCVAVLEGPRGAGGAFSPCCLFTVTKHGRMKAAAADDVLCSSFPLPLILVAGTKL